MGMDNKFVVLDKSKEKLEALHRFVLEVKESTENENSEYKITTYDFKMKPYGEYWGLEGEFRNTVLLDLEHWIVAKGQTDIVNDSIVVINYENSDYAVMYTMVGDNCGESLFSLYDGALCEEGYKYQDLLPMKELKEYFCYHAN